MNNLSKKGFFSTNEFAKLVGVTKHTLFHYDKIGVFSPEIKLENDYRYYSYTQIEIFLVISTLKELGMSLKEIKKYLDNRNPKDLVLLLEGKEYEIDEKINRLTQMKKLISNKVNLTKEALSIEEQHIFITIEKEELLLITEVTEPEVSKGLGIYISKHISNCKNHGLFPPSAIGNIIKLDTIKTKDYLRYKYFFTKVDNKGKNENIYVKKAGKYLNIFHKEGFFSTDKTYENILDFAKNNHLILDKYFYEDVLLDDLSVKGYENYIVKISIRVLE